MISRDLLIIILEHCEPSGELFIASKTLNSISDYVFDPSWRDYGVILRACARKNLESLMKLLKDSRLDPSVHENLIMRTLKNNNQYGIVMELMKDFRVQSCNKSLVFTYLRKIHTIESKYPGLYIPCYSYEDDLERLQNIYRNLLERVTRVEQERHLKNIIMCVRMGFKFIADKYFGDLENELSSQDILQVKSIGSSPESPKSN
jgi:hypothetical protein